MVAITGATGNTGSVAASMLLDHGEAVRVIGRSAERLEPFRIRGAEPAVGDQGDVDFLTRAFEGADAAYILIPPKFDAEDIRAYYRTLGEAAVSAIRRSGLRKVVFLSSLGADRSAGTGPVLGLHDIEQMFETLTDVDFAILRPGYFMENTLGTLELIRTKGVNGSSIPPDAPIMLVASKDIGTKAAELLMERTFTGRSIIELTGDRLSYAKITAVIARALEITHLPYIQFSDDDAIASFRAMGLSMSVAQSYVEMAHGIGQGMVTTTTIEPFRFSAPTRFTEFVDKVFKPAFMAVEHHEMA